MFRVLRRARRNSGVRVVFMLDGKGIYEGEQRWVML
jgi:hypothetical protein